MIAGSADRPRGTAAEARRERIRARLAAEGFVRAEQLAEDFAVSLMTVHRDLDALRDQGWLRKVRGGAAVEPPARDGAAELVEAALGEIEPGESVLLDAGGLNLPLAERLPERGPLTALTNHLAAARALAGAPGIDLHVIGGAYSAAHDALLGAQAEAAAAGLRVDVLVSTAASVTGGQLYEPDQAVVPLRRALAGLARRRILLLESAAFTERGLYRVLSVADFDLVIVDSGADEVDVDALRGAGVTIRHLAGG